MLTEASIGVAQNIPERRTRQISPIHLNAGRVFGLTCGSRRQTVACPMFPETDGHKGNPENVSHIERAGSDGPPRCLAREAVVIAKRNPLRPEMVHTVD